MPKEWIDKYKGKFDGGWDKYREETLGAAEEARHRPAEREAGAQARGHQGLGQADGRREEAVRPADGGLRRRSPRTPTTRSAAWSKAVEDMGELDNTLIFYIVGDNGASAEGGMIGMFNEMTYFNGVAGDGRRTCSRSIDKWGGPETFPHMAAGWAVAGNTPFMWTKQVAANFGGTRNPLVVHWPERDQGQGRGAQPVPPRHRHRADRARGVPAFPSRRRSTACPDADRGRQHGRTRSTTRRPPDRHTTQYFEIFGNRGDLPRRLGRRAPSTRPRGNAQPRAHARPRTCGSSTTSTEDFSEANDLAAEQPGEAQGAAGALHDGGREVPRAADRRPARSSASIPRWRAVPT